MPLHRSPRVPHPHDGHGPQPFAHPGGFLTRRIHPRGLWVVAASLLLAPLDATAQAPSLQDDWRWARFGQEDGVPAGRLREILESDTIPWIGSDQGIAWFDGYRWNRVPVDGRFSRPGRFTPDDRGGIWGIAGEGLIHITKDSLSIVAVPAPAGAEIRWVAQLTDQRLMLVIDTTAAILGRGRLTPIPLPPTAAAVFTRREGRILRTHTGDVWLVAGGIWRWADGRWQPIFDTHPAALRVTDAGGLLAVYEGPRAVIWSWGADRIPRRVGLQGPPPVSLSLAPDGRAVVAFADGAIHTRAGATWSELATPPPGLERMRRLLHRNNGDLWAINAEGLHYWRGSHQRWHGRRPVSRDEQTGFVNAILRDRTGRLWLGTDGGVVVEEPGGSFTRIPEVAGRAISSVTGLAEDREGGIWISSGGGFAGAFRWDGRTWTEFGSAQGLDAQRIHAIVPDRRGDLWFLGLDSLPTQAGPGAFQWDGTRFTRWGPTEGMPASRMYSFAEGPDGTRWFGTADGLVRWREGRWTHWPSQRDGPMRRVYAITVDSTGRPWFGMWLSGGGLGTVEADDRLRWVFTGHEAASEVASLAWGPDGGLWFGTTGGLGRMTNEVVSLLGRASGLRPPRLWPVLPLADRVLAGGDGLFTLDLGELSLPAPRVEINPPLSTAREVLLRWNAMSYWGAWPSAEIETRYRIDGGDWTEWSTARQASLFTMSAGTHRVEVQAKGLYGTVSASPATAEFTIPHPWYRDWPFLGGGSLLLLAGAGVGLLYLRKQREHRRSLETMTVTLAADVAERKRTEAALRESQAFSLQIAGSMPAILVLCDIETGAVDYVNDAVRDVLNIEPEQVLARGTLPEPDDRRGLDGFAALCSRLRATRDGEALEQELTLRTASGEDRILMIRATVLRSNRPAQRGLVVAQDITEPRVLQAQLAHASRMESIGRLAGGVAHDFNNLLTAIIGYAEMASDSVRDDDPMREDLAEITRAAGRAQALTSQLLAFARRQMVEPRVLDPTALIQDLGRMLPRLLGEDITVRMELAPESWFIRIDPNQLEQVLVNLAVNARDAMPDGGLLTIATENLAVLPEWRAPGGPGAGDWVAITVTDTGIGMTAEVMAHAFEPFFTTKGPGEGTGLGLSTCYGIVQQAGGQIEVDGAPGRGARFTITLPRANQSPDPVEREETEAAQWPHGDETVLLVEDEEQVRTLAIRSLRRAGYTVLHATNGRDALDVLAAAGGRIDLLLTDLVMPEMGGVELWTRVRATVPGVRVLFISGYTESSVIRQGVRDHELPFLAKPFSPSALVLKVRQVLDTEAVVRDSL